MNKIEQLRALHIPGDPLVLFNIWDAGSARAVAEAGAKAIATGSYSVAESLGFKDGETVPLDIVLANLERIVSVTELPVTIDMEAGYGDTPAEVRTAVDRALQAGAAGINMEDRLPGQSALMAVPEAAARLAAAAQSGLFVNARTDVYLGRMPEDIGPALVDEVLERARAYADAGASGLFVPFLGDHPSIAAICAGTPLPVNVLWAPGRGSRAELAALGVARISYGHGPWAAAMKWLGDQAAAVFAGETAPYTR